MPKLTCTFIWFTVALLSALSWARAESLVFLSTQMQPVEEAQKARDILLKGAPETSFVALEPAAFAQRVKADLADGKHTIGLVGALHGQLQPLASVGALDALDDILDKLKGAAIPTDLMQLGKFGGAKQLYIPWMQATYVLVVKKDALRFLPRGADIDSLSYDQLLQWAKAIADKTGQRRLGFPAGPKGLFARFLQGYLYPSYTGSMVAEFRSAAAEKMWTDFTALWASVNPNSIRYDFMQDPLQAGEVWIAWDHISRLRDALESSPDNYQVVPPPSGPQGRAYMPIVVGLGIPKGAPDRSLAAAVIAHLLRSEIQSLTAKETGFLPVVEAPADLSPGIKMLAEGVGKTQSAKDALLVSPPVGIGDKEAEFNKVFTDTFQRIVLQGEPVRATLDAQATVMREVIEATKAPCWAPDKSSDGPCIIK